MTTKKRGLSKGLESLLSTSLGGTATAEKSDSRTEPGAEAATRFAKKVVTTEPESGPKTLPSSATTVPDKKEAEATGAAAGSTTNVSTKLVGQLRPGRYQPRRAMGEDELDALAESIKQQGLLQPIVVRPLKKGIYEILAGERRWRASQKAGLTEVPVVIKDVTDQDALAIGIVENIQRENLNAVEEAKALEKLCAEFGLSHQQAAKLVGKSRTVVTNLLRVLNLMPEVRLMLERGEIDLGHAKVLLGLDGPKQVIAAKMVVNKQLSVREAEALVAAGGVESSGGAPKADPAVDPNIRSLQAELTEKVGAVVKISHNTKGAGTLQIRYNSLDELDGILEHIK